MKNQKIRIGVIGIGRMGITHHSIINSNDKVIITSIADPSTFVTSLLKRYLNILTFKNYDDLFNSVQLDALIVATPPHLHYDILKKAAEKNLHVFVEKPFTISYDESLELSNLFQSKKLINQVGYVNRFNDIFKEVKLLIKDNLIGDILQFKSEMFSNTISQNDKSSAGWRATSKSGGGAVYELASHAIDLVNFIIGKPDKVVGTTINSIYSKNVEDSVCSTFLYKNGCFGTININWCEYSYRKPANKFEIFGSKGKILADQHGLKIFLKESVPDKGFKEGWNIRYITDVFTNASIDVRGTEYTHQLNHFIDCIEDMSINNKSTFRDGVDTHDVIKNIFINNEQNKL